MLVLTWGVVVGPEMAARIKPQWLLWLADEGWMAFIVRFAIVVGAIGLQLVAYHLWLAAGRSQVRATCGPACCSAWCCGCSRPGCSARG